MGSALWNLSEQRRSGCEQGSAEGECLLRPRRVSSSSVKVAICSLRRFSQLLLRMDLHDASANLSFWTGYLINDVAHRIPSSTITAPEGGSSGERGESDFV